jgi:hypothetical protein
MCRTFKITNSKTFRARHVSYPKSQVQNFRIIIKGYMDDEKNYSDLKLVMKDIDFEGFKMRVIITYFRVF